MEVLESGNLESSPESFLLLIHLQKLINNFSVAQTQLLLPFVDLFFEDGQIFRVNLQKEAVVVPSEVLDIGVHVEFANVVVIIKIVNLKRQLFQSVFFEVHEVFDLLQKALVVVVGVEIEYFGDNASDQTLVPATQVSHQIGSGQLGMLDVRLFLFFADALEDLLSLWNALDYKLLLRLGLFALKLFALVLQAFSAHLLRFCQSLISSLLDLSRNYLRSFVLDFLLFFKLSGWGLGRRLSFILLGWHLFDLDPDLRRLSLNRFTNDRLLW